MWGPKQNFGPIGPAVLTFIENKRTDKHPDTQTLSIYTDLCNITVS